jgi:hydrogenase maturation protease
MNDILASLELLNHRPEKFTVIGIKPVELADYGGSLTEPVQAQVPVALELGLEELALWGVPGAKRTVPASRETVISALARERYETERPSVEVARRDGDERFLAIRAASRAANAAGDGAAGGASDE